MTFVANKAIFDVKIKSFLLKNENFLNFDKLFLCVYNGHTLFKKRY